MAFSYRLRITESDLQEYLYSLKKNTKINNLWKQILKRMPNSLVKEVATKYTRILEQGDNIYTFKASEVSESLNSFLLKFTIFVGNNHATLD